MNTQEQNDQIQAGAEHDIFRVEFAQALAELMGKIHFRGYNEHEWIAEQIALGLAEEPMIRRHLMELLPAYDELEAGAA